MTVWKKWMNDRFCDKLPVREIEFSVISADFDIFIICCITSNWSLFHSNYKHITEPNTESKTWILVRRFVFNWSSTIRLLFCWCALTHVQRFHKVSIQLLLYSWLVTFKILYSITTASPRLVPLRAKIKQLDEITCCAVMWCNLMPHTMNLAFNCVVNGMKELIGVLWMKSEWKCTREHIDCRWIFFDPKKNRQAAKNGDTFELLFEYTFHKEC